MKGYVTQFSRNYLRKRSNDLFESSKDICKITRPGPSKVVVDPETNVAKRVTGDVTVYEGPCRLWKPQSGAKAPVLGQDTELSRSSLSIPFDAPMPQLNDTALILGSDDPSLIGTRFTIVSTDQGGGLRGSRVMSVTMFEHEEQE